LVRKLSIPIAWLCENFSCLGQLEVSLTKTVSKLLERTSNIFV
jgi:hypothetical protein